MQAPSAREMISPSQFGQPDVGGGPSRLSSFETVAAGGGGGFPDPPYSPRPSESVSEMRTSHNDSDSDSTMSDFFAAELGNWNPANMVSLHPSSMEEQEPPKAAKSSSGYGSSAQQKAEEPKRTKRRRQPVPDERKDGRYWERRRKNNVAARRSRESRRLKQEQDLLKAEQAIQENIRLRAEVDVLKSEICSLRRLLKDANTTLSLWIKARQATEPVHQLPPNLRDKNGPLSFVNFPM